MIDSVGIRYVPSLPSGAEVGSVCACGGYVYLCVDSAGPVWAKQDIVLCPHCNGSGFIKEKDDSCIAPTNTEAGT